MANTATGIESIRVGELHRDEGQPRKYFDNNKLLELAGSIEEKGQLYPILYREDKGRKIIVDGERRLRACQLLGYEAINAIKLTGDMENNHEAVALIGNITREELTAMEEALAVEKLRIKSEIKLTHEHLGKILGKAANTITEILSLAKLPQYIQDAALNSRDWSRAKLIKLANKNNKPDEQKELFDKMAKAIQKVKDGIAEKAPRNAATIAKKHIDTFKEKFTKQLNKVAAEDKAALKEHLSGLKAEIDKMMRELGDGKS